MVKAEFSGLRAWAIQRGGALYMLAWALFATASLAAHPRSTFAQWSAWVHSPGISAGAALFFLALCSHMWVGLRDVVLDYVAPPSLRRSLLVTLAALVSALAAWALAVLFVQAP